MAKALRGGVALLFFAALAAFAQDATLDRARQLIDARQAQAAFELLSPLEQQRAGDAEFDYLLGLAAIDAGQLTRAVFALERVLAVRPDHPQARAEIARAYFLMGENRAAREEFEAVKRAKPPAEAAATIDKFLDALEQRERARVGTGITGYLEASLGHDSNANAATATTSFAIPLFPGLIFNLAAADAERSDEFWSLAGGASGRYAINDAVGLVGAASFDKRTNSSLDQFDTGSLNASGGVNVRDGANDYTVAAQAQSYSVDNTRFRDALGLVAQWRRSIGANDQATAYLQHTRLEYPTQTARNANRGVIGGAWAHAFAGTRAPVLFAGLYFGREAELGQNVPHFGHDLWGTRLGGQLTLSERWTLLANLSYEDRRYGGPDPLFLVNRHDKETQARVSATYALDRNWSFSPAIAYTDNRSNIVVNAYDRTIASITVRYDFR